MAIEGIPCQHVVLAYQHKVIEPEHEVVHWYRKETFLKAYNHFLQPIPNMKMWPHTSGVVIEPSEPKVMPGRPPKCRRKAKNEPRKKVWKVIQKRSKNDMFTVSSSRPQQKILSNIGKLLFSSNTFTISFNYLL